MQPLNDCTGSGLLERLCSTALSRPAVPRTLMILAHPDDECVGAASLLPILKEAMFICVTDGAPRELEDAGRAGCTTREDYANLRKGELLSALDSAGIGVHRLEFLDMVDQETTSHLVPLTLWLEVLMLEHAPEIVLTHPYEGGHPDHDSVAFAVHAARSRIEAAGVAAPVIAEFTSYHLSGGRWQFGSFLPNSETTAITRILTPAESAAKRRLLSCHASQAGVLHQVPVEYETFRVAPKYDFNAPPHDGPLLYERYAWGMTGADWRDRATRAQRALDAKPIDAESARTATGVRT